VHGVRAGAADVSVALVHAVQPSVLGLLPLSLVDTEARIARFLLRLGMHGCSPLTRLRARGS
jgi:hypothetical protein